MLHMLMLLPLLAKMLLLNDPPAGDPPASPPADPPANPPTDAPPPNDPPPDKGFPENTKVEDMTVEQQAAYYKHHSRKWEDRAKARSDYDDLKAKAARLEEIEAANASDAEKAAKAARDEGKAEGLREAGVRMVDAHIEAAVTAQRLTQDQADVLLEGLDRTKYLTAEHSVDTEKVKTLLDRFAPATGNGNGTGRFPDLGQGRRPGGAKVSGKDRGLAEARKRFGDPAAAKS